MISGGVVSERQPADHIPGRQPAVHVRRQLSHIGSTAYSPPTVTTGEPDKNSPAPGRRSTGRTVTARPLPCYSARDRDRPVTADAIITKTAATAIAISHRTQSIPGLPFPPNAV